MNGYNIVIYCVNDDFVIKSYDDFYSGINKCISEVLANI